MSARAKKCDYSTFFILLNTSSHTWDEFWFQMKHDCQWVCTFFSHFRNTHFRMWDTLLTVWIFMNEWKISCLQNGDTFSSDCSAYLCEITAIVRLKPGRWFSTFFMSSSAWPSTLGTHGELLLAISSVVSYSWGDNCGGSETILVILTHTGLISILN